MFLIQSTSQLVWKFLTKNQKLTKTIRPSPTISFSLRTYCFDTWSQCFDLTFWTIDSWRNAYTLFWVYHVVISHDKIVISSIVYSFFLQTFQELLWVYCLDVCLYTLKPKPNRLITHAWSSDLIKIVSFSQGHQVLKSVKSVFSFQCWYVFKL